MKKLIDRVDQSIDWQTLPRLSNAVLQQALTIQQIPAPTFHEAARATYVAEQFSKLHLIEIHVDDRHNVYGLLPGKKPDVPGIMVMAHTDTVFSAETDLTTRTDNGTIYGPGLGDNSIGVAALFGLAEALRDWHITPECNLWFVATSREEGLGDLGGIKQAFTRMNPHIGLVINIEGLAFGHVYHAGIAVRRLHITAHTEGGHSWLHFGRPSAAHAIVQLGSMILTINTPSTPRTTYNIGMLEGGQGINVIASEAGLWLDLRSEDQDTLLSIENQVRAHIARIQTDDLTFKIDVVGDRPAGAISPDHPLIVGARHALSVVGIQGTLETGSTDANIPLSQNCPAVTIGITRGGNAHRLDEFVEIAPIRAGMRQFITLALAAAVYQSQL